ncbi:TetR family transcriptional regulator [Nonomuraea sp. NPDC046570]|uniref:TetR/AcrR family transcriptional regulator n=1 Tax=Nonomuraea sp. NPDC046570 TaxID=3155255 RepID=UPI0033E2D509
MPRWSAEYSASRGDEHRRCALSEPTTDGRRLKGERRRQELIEATLRVVARDGASGVTHRTVAREAGLPTTASTYYFAGIDDLLCAALTSVMDKDAARVQRLTAETETLEEGLRGLAEMMADSAADPADRLADNELYLLAARRPELREPVRRWLEAVAAFARRHTDDPMRVRLFVGALDGLCLQSLLVERPPTVREFEAMLRELLPG